MATVSKSLTLETTALEAGQAAADAAGMTLSAYASRALRKQAMVDNVARAAQELAALPADERGVLDELRQARVDRMMTKADPA